MSTARPTHGVLFDVGHTLLDESIRLDAALAWVADDLASADTAAAITKLDLHAAYLAACRDPDPAERSLLVQALRSLGLPADRAADVRRRLPWDAAPMVAYPDAADALRLLHGAGLKLGVLANQPASAMDDLRRSDLLGFFDDVWLSDACGLHKPDPAFFRLALDAWGLPPQRVAYVGDRPDNDVAPARRLGLYTVRLALGPHADQAPASPDAHPDHAAPTLAAAARHLVEWSHG